MGDIFCMFRKTVFTARGTQNRPPGGARGFKVVDSGFFFRGACLEGLAEPTPRNCVYTKELCVHNTFGVGRIDWCLFSEPGSAI